MEAIAAPPTSRVLLASKKPFGFNHSSLKCPDYLPIDRNRISLNCSASSGTMTDGASGAKAEKSKETKLWEGRFEESVTDAVERFTESISYDKALYKHDISRAHATMLAHQGLMSEGERDSILSGLSEIERMIEAGEFVWRADREDVHMNIEAALTELVGEPAKKLHTARSQNDVQLWCCDAIDTIITRIKQLQVSMFKKNYDHLPNDTLLWHVQRGNLEKPHYFLWKWNIGCNLWFGFIFC